MASSRRPRRLVLALAGGSALGAYQGGAYEALHARGYLPDIVVGASVGAVNGALIAGNAPSDRIDRLREYWQMAAAGTASPSALSSPPWRAMVNHAQVLQTLLLGRPGLFFPRLPGAFALLPGLPSQTSLFDTTPLGPTLERLVDFARLDRAEVPLLATAVDMTTGEPIVFDARAMRLTPRHIVASSGLAPIFPVVDVDGRCVGDPGLYANLPVHAALAAEPEADVLCIAIDLFDARGAAPESLDDAIERAQDVLFGMQSLQSIAAARTTHRLRRHEGLHRDVTLVLAAYRAAGHELGAKTLDFSRASVEERWRAGADDVHAALDALEAGRWTLDDDGFAFVDARRPV